MGNLTKLLADRSGNPFGSRYTAVMEKLSPELWREYPYVFDAADRDNVMEETLQRTEDFEQKHGPAQDLPSLVRRIFSQVVVSLFRKGYYTLHETGIEGTDLDRVKAAPRGARSVEQLVYTRQLMQTVDDRKKEIILLSYQGFKAHEIAAHFGLTEANVYQILHRVRMQFKRIS